MIWRLVNIFALVVAVGAGVWVLQLKSSVKDRQQAVKQLERQIRNQREDIRVLQAEWALLSSPALLQKRSIDFLALMPLRAEQVVASPDAVPMRRRGVDAVPDEGILRDKAQRKRTRSAQRKERNNNQSGTYSVTSARGE